MYWLSFGRWNRSSGEVFTRSRMYWRGGWTPFVRVGLRHEAWQLLALVLPKKLIYFAIIQATADYSVKASWLVAPEITAMEVARWLDTGKVEPPELWVQPKGVV